jgi:hypothetical protein
MAAIVADNRAGGTFMKRPSVFLLAALSIPTVANAQEVLKLECQIKETFVCEAGAACRALPVEIWNLIDTAGSNYARCNDARGCDNYDARVSYSGNFVNIEVPGRGIIATVSRGGAFHEVATILHSVLVSVGTCKRTS